ncbi:MAG: inorganic phosphate transporter [Thermoanaerobacterales bacterium]|nr:inorganic phosphate transporter [Bacillota bacterium]MDI6906226.1 inorganic phosphate transporter [Thermoanaerobacterales bacterium]
MESDFAFVVAVVVLALAFDFINGFHDTANCVATAVATGALPPRLAVGTAAALNLVGALAFTGVARTVGGGIANPWALEHGLYAVLAALMAAILWNLATWWLGLPSSSSHALIGSLAGAVLAAAGFGGLHLRGFMVIAAALLFTPPLAMTLGFGMRYLIGLLPLSPDRHRAEAVFRRVQVFTAIGQSFSHGTNDAQKTMGIITLALVAGGLQGDMSIPLWVKVSAASAMGLGTACGGWRIIRTVGYRIFSLRPRSGVSADLASVATIMGATLGGLPVSTTHVVSSAIVGVGVAGRPSDVRWHTMKMIVSAWIITLPATAVLAAVIYTLIARPRHF